MADKINTVSSALDTLNVKLGGTAGDIPADATKVDALKKVYETLGGTPADVADLSTTYELVEKIADVAQGGGGGGESDCVVTTASISSDENFNRTYSFEVPFAPNQFFIYYRANFATPTKKRAVCIAGGFNFDAYDLTFIGVSESGGAFSLAGGAGISVDYDDGILSIYIPDNVDVAFGAELLTSEGWRITGIFTTI